MCRIAGKYPHPGIAGRDSSGREGTGRRSRETHGTVLGRVWDLPNGRGDLISMMETEVHIRPVLPAWRLLHTYMLMQVPGYPPKTKTMSSWSKPPAEANIGAPAMSPYPIMSPDAGVHTVDAHPSRQTYLCSRHRISPWSDLLFFFV